MSIVQSRFMHYHRTCRKFTFLGLLISPFKRLGFCAYFGGIMFIELLSIIIFTFSLALFVLGGVTWWIEKRRRRIFGALMMVSALCITVIYAFLGSRFSIAWFGRLIITVDLPQLMTSATIYTFGVLLGFSLAGGVFLWISGRMIEPTRFERQLLSFVLAVLLVALVISLIAVQLSH